MASGVAQPIKHSKGELQQYQSLPLQSKINMTQQRIKAWVEHYGEDGVYVSFSGGKDSTVLLYLVRELYPNVPAVFVDTGLEYPEIRQFVKTFRNVTWLKPKKTFKQVIKEYGYPFIGKEVSEKAYYAKKYLTWWLNEHSIDRPTDRPTDRPRKIPTVYAIADLFGITNRKAEKYGLLKKGIIPSEFLEEIMAATQSPYKAKALFGMLTYQAADGEIDKSRFDFSRHRYLIYAPWTFSNHCCNVMKKSPAHKYAHKTGRKCMTAQMASESSSRALAWMRNGCNGFDMKEPVSNPMAFWTEQDVLLFLYQYGKDMVEWRKREYVEDHPDENLEEVFANGEWGAICSVYGDIVPEGGIDDYQIDFSSFGLFDREMPSFHTTGCSRTGCMFCGYGCHMEKPGEGRFLRLKETHPKVYDYIMRPEEEGGLNYREIIDWINANGGYHIEY